MGVLLGPLVGVVDELPSRHRNRDIFTSRSVERSQLDAGNAAAVTDIVELHMVLCWVAALRACGLLRFWLFIA